MQEVVPFGAWRSPLAAEAIARGARRLSQPRWHEGRVWWIEGRPDEGGRHALVRARPGGAPEDATPTTVNARSRVHEYGGGDYDLGAAGLFLVDDARGGALVRAGGEALRAQVPGARYAEPVTSPDGRWLAAVEEEPREGEEPANRLVLFDLARGRRRVVDERHDFVASPAFAPDGRRLAWLAWDHPNMPWDGTRLLEVRLNADGPGGTPRHVAGDARTSVFQPLYSPAGRLTFASDASGWWNLVQEREIGPVPLCPRAAEFGLPQWVFGMRSFGFEDEGRIVCTFVEEGLQRLARLRLESGDLETIPSPYTVVEGLRVADGRAVFVGSGPERPAAVVALDLASRRLEEVAHAFALPMDAAWVARPEALTLPSAEGRPTHAFLYRPTSPTLRGPSGERPPLLVKSHGGPTGAASAGFDARIQYWTTRGFAVMDVNYGGSTGFGRAYRELLRGAWGVVDVDDCCAAARFAAREGLADAARLAITGGSAGGYTTLACLVFRDVFAAGASHYGVADLEALARDTHKFESRYLDALVGPWPARSDLYRERSPIHHLEGLRCPVIFFQGLQDRVVPPSQAEAMAAALARRGLPHALVRFPDEGHGFRRAANIRLALEGELFFYGRVLGFESHVRPPIALSGAGVDGGPEASGPRSGVR